MRHGDIYDSINYDGNRDRSSLGDAIVTELLARFPKAVEDRLRSRVSIECIRGLKEIDNVRPVQMSPVWIAGVVARTSRNPGEAAAIKGVWNDMVTGFFLLDFVKQHYAPRYWLTLLTWWFSRLLPLQLVGRILVRFNANSAPSSPSYQNALSEPALASGSTLTVVYGHTHIYQLVPLDSKGLFEQPEEQIYINSGTWRPYHELAMRHPAQLQFVGYHLFTFLGFYKDGERRGRSYEVWNGTLDAHIDQPG
jgi:hypothetical protein